MLGVCQMQPFRSCVPLCRADVGSWRSGALPFALNSRCIRREGQAQALALLHQSSSLLLQKQQNSAAKTPQAVPAHPGGPWRVGAIPSGEKKKLLPQRLGANTSEAKKAPCYLSITSIQ